MQKQDQLAKQRQRDEEAAFAALLLAFFAGQAATIAEALRQHGAGAPVGLLFRPADWDEPLREKVRGELLRLAALGAAAELAWGKELADARGITLDEDKIKADADAQSAKLLAAVLALAWWAAVNEAVQADLERLLAEGVGLGPDELAARVETALADAARPRAAKIAASETTGAIGAGTEPVRNRLAEFGLIAGKKWVAIIDDHTRDDHLEADGQVVAVGSNFTVGGEQARYPGDPNLSPEQRVNCRCVAVSIPADGGGL